VKTFLFVLWGIAMLAIMIFSGRAIMDRRITKAEIQSLRDQVYTMRVAADSCRNAIYFDEEEFRRFDSVVDSLRTEVRTMESLDVRGVPEARYEEYLAVFGRYNDSVAVWPTRAEALRVSNEACQSTVVRHNAIGDSLRRRLEGLVTR